MDKTTPARWWRRKLQKNPLFMWWEGRMRGGIAPVKTNKFWSDQQELTGWWQQNSLETAQTKGTTGNKAALKAAQTLGTTGNKAGYSAAALHAVDINTAPLNPKCRANTKLNNTYGLQNSWCRANKAQTNTQCSVAFTERPQKIWERRV